MRKREAYIEVISSLEEFKAVIDSSKRLHYKPLSHPGAVVHGLAVEWIGGIEIYGIAKEGHIVKLVLAATVRMEDIKYNVDLYTGYGIWAKKKAEEFLDLAKRELRQDITLGYYEPVEVRV